MWRNRRGFSALELMIVLVIMGVMFGIAAPRMVEMRERNSLNSAKQKLTGAIAAARAAAIQRGRPTTFQVSGNSIEVTVMEPNGSTSDIVPNTSMQIFGTTLSTPVGGATAITYDSRGNASSSLAQRAVFVLEKGPRRDSVCVSRFGMLMTGGCL